MRRLAAVLAVPVVVAACTGSCGAKPAPPGANVLLVSIEALRTDHVGAVRDGIPLTPNLDALAAAGTRFDAAYAAAAFTLPSLHTITTGEPPPVHRVRFWTHFGNRFRGPTLATLFRERGYRTGFFTGHGYLDPYPLLRRDFDAWEAQKEARASFVLDHAQRFLDETGDRPFFLWLHVFEPHTPYAPEDEYARGVADLDAYHAAGPATFSVETWIGTVPDARGPALADALYASEVRAADAALGSILAELDRRGLRGNTLVCVVADHGESLSWDPPPRWDHAWTVDRHLVHVPLVIAGPGIAAGAERSDLARHLDLAPTLVARTGGRGVDGWLGRDLFGDTAPPRFVVAESSIASRQDAPFFTVTDTIGSLRIDPSTGKLGFVDETAGRARRTAVDPDAPDAASAARLAFWRELAPLLATRAAERNDAGEDRATLSPEQEAMLRGAGYLR